MEKKLHFLKNEADFKKFRTSKSFSTPLFRMRVVSTNQNFPRFGFIVPKKLVPKVVERNLIKRRIKAILAKYIKNILPAEILFFPQKQIVKTEFAVLENEIVNTVKKSRLWKQ